MKFRIWNENTKSFCQLGEYFVSSHGNVYHFEPMDNELVYDGNCVVQLSTGLFDRTGMEIYEGDLVQRKQPHGQIYKCEYSLEEAGYVLKFYNDFLYLSDFKDLLVVGNIFENNDEDDYKGMDKD